MSLDTFLSTLQLGLVYSVLALGLFLSFRILDTPDLTVDGSFVTGMAISAVLTLAGHPILGLAAAFAGGLSAGLVTGLDDGEAIMESWANNGLTVPGANAAALEAVTTGEKGILIAGVDYNAYSSIADGEPINIYYPESGTVVNPRPAMIMKTAPNMENAEAFIDFLFSDEAQQLVADAYLLPGRSDVECSNRTNLDEIPQIDTNWDEMMQVADDTAAKLNELCQ